jgi:N-acetylmuramoyl-L-alanine amidase
MFILDPGHGGSNIGALNGYENMLNLNVALMFERVCASLGMRLVPTRRSEIYVSWEDRRYVANKGNYVISIHHNASIHARHHGLELYHWPGNEVVRSVCMLARDFVPQQLRSPNCVRAADKDYPGANYVCSVYDPPTILVECCYLTNDNDLAFTKDQYYLDHMAAFLLQLNILCMETFNES